MSRVFREVVKGLAKNTSIMLFQQMITWGSTFLLMLFLPRYLGPVDFGRLFLASSIADIFRVLVSYGGNYYITKNVSRAPETTGQILVDSVSLRLIFAVFSVTSMLVFSYSVGYPEEVHAMMLVFGLGLFFESGTTSLYACYQGRELMQYTSSAAIVQRVFVSVVAVTSLLLGAQVVLIAVIMNVGFVLQLLVLSSFSKKLMSGLPRVNWRNVFLQLKDGAQYFLFAVFSMIYYRINSVMLSRMTPETVVGWYGGASRLFDTFNFLPYIFTIAVYPVLARLWKSEEQMHKRTTQKSLEFIIVAGVPVVVIVFGCAPHLIRLFYGLADYAPSITILQVLTLGLLILYVDMILGTTLLSSDKQRQQSLLALGAIPVNIGLNYVMIPYFQGVAGNGGIGAAAATVITEVGIMVGMISLLPKGILRGFRYSVLVKVAAAGTCIAIILYFAEHVGLPWVLNAIISVLTYFVMLYKLDTFEPAETEVIKTFLSSRSFGALRRAMSMRRG